MYKFTVQIYLQHKDDTETLILNQEVLSSSENESAACNKMLSELLSSLVFDENGLALVGSFIISKDTIKSFRSEVTNMVRIQ